MKYSKIFNGQYFVLVQNGHSPLFRKLDGKALQIYVSTNILSPGLCSGDEIVIKPDRKVQPVDMSR